MIARTRGYARVGDACVAYVVAGAGPIDLVYSLGLGGQVDLMWDYPPFAHYLERLASFSRLIMFDRRGQGASDPVPLDALPTLEEWMQDLRAVMDAVSSTHAAIYGELDATPLAILFAATYPERTSGLVLAHGSAKYVASDDHPSGELPDTAENLTTMLRELWGTDALGTLVMPSLAGDDRYLRWWWTVNRAVATPRVATALFRYAFELDLRAVLPLVRCPTLVLQRTSYPFVRVTHGRFLAERITGARLLELPGSDQWFFTSGSSETLEAIQELVTGARAAPATDRVLATVLFTDIVDSTARAVELGDERWKAVIDAHDELTRSHVERLGGRVVKMTGDGALATFEGPGRALRAALELVAAARGLGIELRAGVHTGEIEVRDGDIGGIAVHIGARVMGAAGPGELLCSRTVRDLVAGAGFSFADRGVRTLKGVPEARELFAVASETSPSA